MISFPNGYVARLRNEKPEIALRMCIFLTTSVWHQYDRVPYATVRQLWSVFDEYIAHNYQEEGVTVPDDIRPLWNRCKPIIDKEAAR